MNTIHNLQKLLRLIIVVITKTIRADRARVYLFDQDTDRYVLKAPPSENGISFDKDDPLMQRLKKENYPLVYDELRILSDSETKDTALHDVVAQMQTLLSEVIVPITMSDNLLGFLVLGERRSKQDYSKELLNTLSVLGNQVALAIENCHYIEAETKRLEAEGLKERMISLDHMASSMAHEIDNPMHIIRQSLGFIQEFLLNDPRGSMPRELKQDYEDALLRSQGAAERVSGMIKAILDYSRMGTGKLESVRISDALEGFLQLIQPQIREERVQFTREIEDNLPPVLGDKVQMEEVFMNFVRNSLHAVRRNEEKRIFLKIARKNEKTIRIECTDNGYGIPGEIINDIFLSSMTTKGSSEGTGLGLYRVRKIVDLFRGKVWAESEGKGKGATFIVELPVYEKNGGDILKNNNNTKI
jgi:two-component system sensor kinase FixL